MLEENRYLATFFVRKMFHCETKILLIIFWIQLQEMRISLKEKQESEEHTSDLTKSLPKRPDCSSSPKISKTLLYESHCMAPFYTNFAKGKHEQQT